MRANDEFHSVILEAAGNHSLTLTIGVLRQRLPHNLSFATYAGNSRLIKKNLAEHEAIAAALLEQDHERARRLMSRTSATPTRRSRIGRTSTFPRQPEPVRRLVPACPRALPRLCERCRVVGSEAEGLEQV
jgi:DNA-binding FadR family transcriptional regulator